MVCSIHILLLGVIVFAHYSDARPTRSRSEGVGPSFGLRGIDSYIIGGTDASPGAWPWQLSLQYLGTSWYHTCGASLLSPTKVLTAAHCVDGRVDSSFRIQAGLNRLSQTSGVQTVGVSRYVKHERYELDESLAASSHDIAIAYLVSSVTTNSYVQFLALPPNDNDNFAGKTCVMTGWGRTSSANTSPDVLKQGSIAVITTTYCNSLLKSISGAYVWDWQICLYNTTQNIGSCSGDSGGPLNCPDGYGGYYVAGVTSWGISNTATNTCLQSYPSVYTRTSSYIYWIFSN